MKIRRPTFETFSNKKFIKNSERTPEEINENYYKLEK